MRVKTSTPTDVHGRASLEAHRDVERDGGPVRDGVHLPHLEGHRLAHVEGLLHEGLDGVAPLVQPARVRVHLDGVGREERRIGVGVPRADDGGVAGHGLAELGGGGHDGTLTGAGPPGRMGVPTLACRTRRAQNPRLLMIGNAHIDPMWIWAWDEGMHEVIQTFRAAADRLEEDPDLTFTASSASYYRWVMETSPELFARIRVLVADGRWIVTGSQWVEPDCNLAAGESVCRQLLYGQRFLAEHLGVTARIGYNVDSFGHAGSLPQLLAAAGIGAYVFMRPGPDEKDLPSPAFRWRGTDGTELPAYRIPIDYSTPSWAEEKALRTRAAELLARSGELGIPLMGFFGVGDHGGGPTRLAMATVHALAAEDGGAVAFGDPAAYFEILEGSPGLLDALPVVEGELQWHAVGCYSVHADLKLANTRAEDALVAAEAFTEMCRLLTGDAPDVRLELAAAWEGVLFAQFHDALGGTCTDGATEAVRALLVSGAARAEQLAVRALHRLAEQVDTWFDGAEAGEGIESAVTGLPVPMLVCNPHSWAVTGSVSLPHAIAVATDAEGRRVTVQQVASGEVTYSPTRGLLQVSVPPLGYRRYWLHVLDPEQGAPAGGAVAAARAGDDAVLTNGRLRLRAWTWTPVCWPVRRVRVATWRLAPSSWRVVSARSWSRTTATPGRTASPATTDPEEAGRLLSVDVVEQMQVARHRAQRLVVRRREDEGRPGGLPRRWPRRRRGAPRRRLARGALRAQARRPLALDQPSSTAGAPYGSVGRPCTGHEEPMLHWVDLSGAAAGWGVACLTEGAGGYDALDATLRLTVLRSPRVADHGRGWGAGDAVGYPFTDQGRHRARYALVPHAGPAAGADLPRRAAEHRVTLPVVLDTWHRGPLGPEGSAVHLEGEGVLLPVLKRAEDGGGTVARLWEVAGSRRRVRLSLGAYRRSFAVRLGGRAPAPRGADRLRARREPHGLADRGHPRARRAASGRCRLSRAPGPPSRARHRPAPGRGGALAPGPHRRGGRDRLRRGQRRQRGRRRAHRGRADEGHGASAPPRRLRAGLVAGPRTELHDGRGRLPGRPPRRRAPRRLPDQPVRPPVGHRQRHRGRHGHGPAAARLRPAR